MTYVLLGLVILANAFANIFIKIGMDNLPVLDWKNVWFSLGKILTSPFVVGGALLLIISFPIFGLVLQRMNLSIAYPALVIGAIVVVTLVSAIFLKESISLFQLGGIILVMVGVWLLFRK
ncbi:MAG: hypothetical protein U9P90_01340 [Patescibacteria group bacterium]|nr:hypothetical protein [Patescibacteria group bacterium]